MLVEALELENFRNYRGHTRVQFDPHINILVGLNAQGKTNILESVYTVAHTKSYRSSRNSELINFNEQVARIALWASNNLGRNYFSLVVHENNTKLVHLNGKKVQRASDLLGYLTVVLFSPEDILIITGSPSDRRDFVDRFIAQVRPSYAPMMGDYYKIIRQRNQTLRDIKYRRTDETMLTVWDEQLTGYADSIVKFRKEATTAIEGYANTFYALISEQKEELTLEYIPSFRFDEEEYNGSYAGALAEKLLENRKRDVDYGTTNVGPHRDDIRIMINGNDTRAYASQGQKRLISLSLKYAEAKYIREKTGEYPVLLFDDVLLELDLRRKHNLLVEMIQKAQIIITTTDVKRYQEAILENSSLFRVSNGTITKVDTHDFSMQQD